MSLDFASIAYLHRQLLAGALFYEGGVRSFGFGQRLIRFFGFRK